MKRDNLALLFICLISVLAVACTETRAIELKDKEKSLITLKIAVPEGGHHTLDLSLRSGTPEDGTAEEQKMKTLKFFIYNWYVLYNFQGNYRCNPCLVCER